MVKGNNDISELNSILIGEEFSKEMLLEVGDELSLVSAENKELKLIVRGIFKTGFLQYDSNLVIVPLTTMQILSERGEVVTQIGKKTSQPQKVENILSEVRKTVDSYDYFAVSWKQTNQTLLNAVQFEKFVLVAILSLLLIIACFAVSVILNMIVREKIKDIGIMRSMGFSRKSIMKIFLIQGMLLGIAGIIIGTVIALCFLWYIKNYTLAFITSIYYLTKIPVEISIKEIGVIIGANIGIIFVSSVFPAYRAARMETVEALRHE